MKPCHQNTTPFWHTLSCEAVCQHLTSSPEGLTAVEAARRLAEHGPNELQESRRTSPWKILFAQFKNVLIVILLIATVLSALLGHDAEAVAIAVIVVFAVMLGFGQEYRAEGAMAALCRMAAPTAAALRDGEEVAVPARELVPGDVILLRAGDKIPADSRLIEAVNLNVEEAALTGESVPVEKHPNPITDTELVIGDRRNMGYAGTVVTYGRGRAVVVATGMQTEFGTIARLLQTIETGKTPLQENLDGVGRTLAKASLVIVAVTAVIGLVRGQPLIEMFIFGIAFAVAVVPEALPAVVTISLAIGVQRMAKRNALMRRLAAVETLGSTSIICSDKTGTLTKDEMTVRKILTAGQLVDVTGTGYEPNGRFLRDGLDIEPSEKLKLMLRAATLCSDAHVLKKADDGRWHVIGDPTEGALVVAAAKAGLDKAHLDTQFPRVNEIPFTSETKRMTTLHLINGSMTSYSKGALEIILDGCTAVLTGRGEVTLDASERDVIMQTARRLADDALRVLAVAAKSGATRENAEHGMTFLGMVGMIDPPRSEVRTAIQTCEQAGIKPVMITGDHPLTAQAVARELGLLKGGRVVTGAQLDAMSEVAFDDQVETIDVYARVSPVHKLRVVTAMQKKGHVVAMTGDGINDAPALKKADIGIAMGITGTDVTKEAAAMTLTDDNFASIVAAVEAGRGIFANIKKYLMYLLSSNAGEVVLIAGATLLGFPLPLSAVQILLVNVATDGLPALALSVDPPEPDLMHRKPRNPRTGIFTPPVVILMLMGGIWSGIVNLCLFTWAWKSGRSHDEAMTMTFVTLILIEFFKAYNFRSDRHSVLNRPFANRWLNLAVAGELFLLAIIIYIPILQQTFGTFCLTLADWAVVLSTAVTISPVLESGKWMVRRDWFGKMR